MLQQTQVERVVPKYEDWLARWASWSALAQSSRQHVLAAWSGLGYNRRAVNLHRLAGHVVSDYGGQLPDDESVLLELPGIGPYTARAILIFAYNQPVATVDTNVRRVLIHELGLDPEIGTADLWEIARQLVPPRRSRDWHNGLMDYSALRLPRRLTGVPPTSKQSVFVGSRRQIRGEIVRRLTRHRSIGLTSVARALGQSTDTVRSAAESLAVEGMVRITGQRVELIDGSDST